MKRVAFFHGLESEPRSEKNTALEHVYGHVYAPPMDYENPRLFDMVLADVKKQNIDLLIGSSMGGWFAYCISTITGIPTLLFNPAFNGRTLEPRVKIGSIPTEHNIVLGKRDTVVNPEKSIDWFSKNGVGTANYNWESIEHRIPIDTFMRWIKSPIQPKRIVESFDAWMAINEMNTYVDSMYHGGDVDFNKPMYFTNSILIAQSYGKVTGPYQIILKKFITLDFSTAEGWWLPEDAAKNEVKKFGMKLEDFDKYKPEPKIRSIKTDHFVRAAIDKGFDGIIFQNIMDAGSHPVKGNKYIRTNNVVVIQPKKSTKLI
jgi:hypothetical protein